MPVILQCLAIWEQPHSTWGTASWSFEHTRQLRKSVNREIQSSKSKYYCELIEERKGDSTKIWRAINEVSRNPKSSTPQCIISNDVQHTDPTALNSFFASVEKTLADKFSYLCSKFSTPKDVQVGSFCLKEIDTKRLVWTESVQDCWNVRLSRYVLQSPNN